MEMLSINNVTFILRTQDRNQFVARYLDEVESDEYMNEAVS